MLNRCCHDQSVGRIGDGADSGGDDGDLATDGDLPDSLGEQLLTPHVYSGPETHAPSLHEETNLPKGNGRDTHRPPSQLAPKPGGRLSTEAAWLEVHSQDDIGVEDDQSESASHGSPVDSNSSSSARIFPFPSCRPQRPL